ncbi:MAG: DUF4242 domain-containing protein [Rhodobacteraceae bacterium]|nr:DUF4242 domain-containing protein [Paracoccaceae bacterium]
MKRFIIEREIPGIGGMSVVELCGAARASNQALSQLPTVQWQHSYVADDKTFCVYLAEDEDAVKKHAELSGFPANKITEAAIIMDPLTAIMDA